MAAQIIDGKAIAERIRAEIREKSDGLARKGVRPGLAVILVGEDPPSVLYVNSKEKTAAEVGFTSKVLRMPEDTTQRELIAEIRRLNADTEIHGILVQMPLPKHLDEKAAMDEVDPDKDVDGLHVINAGRLAAGIPCLAPCTPKGVIELLKRCDVPMKGSNAVVVGRSNLVGKPVAQLLLAEHATVTICHSRTRDLADITRRADILVVAIRQKNFITGDMIKPGAAVIDVGINRVDGKVVGDVDFDAAREVAGAITPMPGGVGRMTVAMLLSNTVDAAERSLA